MNLNTVTEEHVIRDILEIIGLNKGTAYRTAERIPRRDAQGRIRGRCQTPGLPDIYARFTLESHIEVLSGGPSRELPIRLWIEAKRPKGRRRPAQEKFVAEENEAGGLACFAESREDVIRYLAGKFLRLRIG